MLRSLPSGRIAFGLLAAGWAWALVAIPLRVFSPEVAASFAAFWLVVVLLAVSVWDLFLTIVLRLRNPGIELAEEQRLPAWLRPWATWFVPAGLLVGIAFGHRFWH